MTRSLVFIVAAIIIVTSCTPGVLPTSSSEKYVENLSILRPKYPSRVDTSQTESIEIGEDYSKLKPSYDVTEELHMVLDSIDILNEDVRSISGFTIQIYSGPNSNMANIARGKVYAILPDVSSRLKFEEPSFKVKVGKYYSRLEAQDDFQKLRARFPSAIVIPERLYIK